MTKNILRIRALLLFSGGLDSILAAKILQKPAIYKEKRAAQITGLTFVSYFFNARAALASAETIGLPLKIIDFSQEHFNLVKKPKYGYGRAHNPCIDCHLLMLQKAHQILIKENYDFVATGEVLGQRPMSQNKNILALLESKSNLTGKLLRPLSAKLLKPTIMEDKNIILRSKLLSISGKSRKQQIALANKFKITHYQNPAGGCILTDLAFGKKLHDMLSFWPNANGSDVQLLTIGRHFWRNSNLLIVGRNHTENQQLKDFSAQGDVFVEPKYFPGPSVLIRSKNKTACYDLKIAEELICKYSPKIKKST